MLTCYALMFIDGTETEEGELIPVPAVSGEILKLVIDWCTYHKDDPEVPEGQITNICPWDAEFLDKMDQSTLLELIVVPCGTYRDFKNFLKMSSETASLT